MKNMDEIRAELKKELNNLRKAEQESDALDQAYDENPEDAEIETAWDQAYKKEVEIFQRCAELIAKMTGIEKATAATMIRSQRERIEAII